VPTINLPFVGQLLDPASAAALEPSAYGLMVSETPAPPTRPQAVDPPSADPGPYLSYAVQWILFAIMGFVFIWYVIRSERRARREDAEDRAAIAAGIEPPARAPRNRGRRDRDAEDEDALLDRTH
jgi:hypothetical protein